MSPSPSAPCIASRPRGLPKRRSAWRPKWTPCPTHSSPCCSAARARPSASRPRTPRSSAPSSRRSSARPAGHCSSRPRAAPLPRRLPRALRRHQGRSPHRLGRHRRQSLLRAFLGLADAIVVTEDSVNIGHRGRRHRQAGLCPSASGPLAATLPLPPPHTGAGRDSPLRRQARDLELRADQRYRNCGLGHPARARP
jgi:hypothetical protein